MDKELEIKTVGQKKLDNAMHVTYHTAMHGILKSADQAKTGIPAEIMTDYNGGITEETELNREAQADALTAELQKADTARDRAVQYLFAVIRSSRLSPDEATQKAAEGLMPTVSAYRGIHDEAADRETALLNGLLTDLKKPDLAAHLTTLGLSALPARLEALNKTFAELAIKRRQPPVCRWPPQSARGPTRPTSVSSSPSAPTTSSDRRPSRSPSWKS